MATLSKVANLASDPVGLFNDRADVQTTVLVLLDRSTSTQTGKAKRQRRPATIARGVLAAGSGTSIGGQAGQVAG